MISERSSLMHCLASNVYHGCTTTPHTIPAHLVTTTTLPSQIITAASPFYFVTSLTMATSVSLPLCPPHPASSQLSVKNIFVRGSVVRYIQIPRGEVDTELLQDACRKETEAKA